MPNGLSLKLNSFWLFRHSEDQLELTVSVLEAKGLICPLSMGLDSLDTFVRIYLVPDHAGGMQTKVSSRQALEALE